MRRVQNLVHTEPTDLRLMSWLFNDTFQQHTPHNRNETRWRSGGGRKICLKPLPPHLQKTLRSLCYVIRRYPVHIRIRDIPNTNPTCYIFINGKEVAKFRRLTSRSKYLSTEIKTLKLRHRTCTMFLRWYHLLSFVWKEQTLSERPSRERPRMAAITKPCVSYWLYWHRERNIRQFLLLHLWCQDYVNGSSQGLNECVMRKTGNRISRVYFYAVA